jgi:hypothetical protein
MLIYYHRFRCSNYLKADMVKDGVVTLDVGLRVPMTKAKGYVLLVVT